MPTKEFILSEIRRTAEANGGKALGQRRFQSESGVGEWQWRGKYGWRKWGDAVREAGYVSNELRSASDGNELLQSLADLTRTLSRFPTEADLRLSGARPATFLNRLGSKPKRLQRVVQFCRDNAGYEDVLALCEAEVERLLRQARVESTPAEVSQNGLVRGFVYLIKSGRDYKVGATSDVEQRISAFNHQLPHPPREVHRIATDDIFGIEKYWHRRFDSKRIRGEWFSLTQADVAAFRMRKFM